MSGQRFKNVRAHTRALHFDDLLARSGDTCHWCRREVVRVAHVLAEYPILARSRSHVTFVNHFGKTRTVRVATLDHVMPLSHGGSHGPENLVIACATCNHQRGAASDLAALERAS